MWASLVYFRLLLTKLWGIMCFSLVSMLDFMGQNLTPLKSRLSKLQSWHQNFSCLVGPNEHFYTRCLLSARTSHGTLFMTFAPRLSKCVIVRGRHVASNVTTLHKANWEVTTLSRTKLPKLQNFSLFFGDRGHLCLFWTFWIFRKSKVLPMMQIWKVLPWHLVHMRMVHQHLHTAKIRIAGWKASCCLKCLVQEGSLARRGTWIRGSAVSWNVLFCQNPTN